MNHLPVLHLGAVLAMGCEPSDPVWMTQPHFLERLADVALPEVHCLGLELFERQVLDGFLLWGRKAGLSTCEALGDIGHGDQLAR